MSRSMSSDLKSHLGGESLCLAQCAKIVRRDGVILGFTTWDADIVYDGVTYERFSALSPSNLKAHSDVTVDNLEIMGVLSSDSILESDVLANRYDGAVFTLFRINPRDTSMGIVVDQFGTIGEIRLQEGQYVAELLSIEKRLTQHPRRLTGPLCRVTELGNAECMVDLTGFTHSYSVLTVLSNLEFVIGPNTNWDAFIYGTAHFGSGANAGFTREVKTSAQYLSTTNQRITLAEPFPFAVSVGDSVTLVEGCNRTAFQCRTKFSNMRNFRGEPFIPLTDRMRQGGGNNVVPW